MTSNAAILVMALRPISISLFKDFSKALPSGVLTVIVKPPDIVPGKRTKTAMTASSFSFGSTIGGSQVSVTASVALSAKRLDSGNPPDMSTVQSPAINSPLLVLSVMEETDTSLP